MDSQEDFAKDQPIDALLDKIQAFVRAHGRPGSMTVDQFIAERRQEAFEEELRHRG